MRPEPAPLPPESERGVALLTVLLLVAVLSVIAATALDRLTLATSFAANANGLAQARGYAYAAETLASKRIDDLVAANPARLTLAGDWNGRAQVLPIPGGLATAQVRDGGNCFNLNSLVRQRAPDVYLINDVAREQFIQLMLLVGVDQNAAYGIAAAATDWIDSDGIPVRGGAEDSDYRAEDIARLPANRLMAHPSELAAVRGVTPEIMGLLRPWVCALPEAELSPININTLLPEQAPLLAMLVPNKLGVDGARSILEARPALGYPSIQRFWTLPALARLEPQPDVEQQVRQTTRYFAVELNVTLGPAELSEEVLIDAQRPPSRPIYRSYTD